jgi:hypothetical protein
MIPDAPPRLARYVGERVQVRTGWAERPAVGTVIAPPPALPMLYPGPSPRTVAEARAVLEGLGRTYRHLSERDTKIVFELYRAAGLA